MSDTLNPAALAQALRTAVLAQHFERTPDPRAGGAALRHFPSIDLAVCAFTPRGPVAANVLFSREHPQGHVAQLGPQLGPLQDVRFDADLRDAELNSIAWAPDADWSRLQWLPLGPQPAGAQRFVAPYPASLCKLMVAVGLALALDAGSAHLDEAWTFEGRTRMLRDWQFDMLAVSCNTATSALVALLHARDVLGRPHALHALFERLGLPTLRLAQTRSDGGWGNAAGAGVGQLQMTAWDTLRLLWWLDPDAPSPPWLDVAAPRLQPGSRDELLRGLRGQGLDIVLSSAALAGLPGWQPGIPGAVQPGWVDDQGVWRAGEYDFPPAVHPLVAQVQFAHKIGNTENYSSDAGIVRSLRSGGRHYLIALFSNLGSRYAPHPLAAGPWGLPALGAHIDAYLARALA